MEAGRPDVPGGLLNDVCVHHWFITEKFPPRRYLKVVEKYAVCTTENGTQFMGERVTYFNRDIKIDEGSATNLILPDGGNLY